jgi:CheY-like chemotaxis protein
VRPTVAEDQPLRGFVVLVVDDDVDTLDSVTSVIRELVGCEVLAASSGDQALAILDAGAVVDLVFADVVMPRMNGLTLTNVIRDRLPQVPVVLTTGLPTAVNLALKYGAIALLKPYSPEQLQAVFAEQLLVDRRQRGQLATVPAGDAQRSPSAADD